MLACQAGTINRDENTRSTLLKFNANIYFNRRCLANKIIPKYAHVNFTNSSPAVNSTAEKAQVLRVNTSYIQSHPLAAVFLHAHKTSSISLICI